ncbi:hypothetical protein CEXT_235111 [Caerostris extrusa]|uniref:Uncharacterized protein n=1 Tax=Caerostris extrusa TaxID=172846 RepID=A0AAV4NKI8_CAEEX|nr:hypothetical protein CEXT_235111 [Caerostris extrusa]
MCRIILNSITGPATIFLAVNNVKCSFYGEIDHCFQKTYSAPFRISAKGHRFGPARNMSLQDSNMRTQVIPDILYSIQKSLSAEETFDRGTDTARSLRPLEYSVPVEPSVLLSATERNGSHELSLRFRDVVLT